MDRGSPSMYFNRLTYWLAKKVQRRLTAYALLILLLFILFIHGGLYYYLVSNQLEQQRHHHQQLALTLQPQAEVALFAENEAMVNDLLNGLLANPTLLAATVHAKEGHFNYIAVRQLVAHQESRVAIFADQDGITAQLLTQILPDFTEAVQRDRFSIPLASPVYRSEQIGDLWLIEDRPYLERQAHQTAQLQVGVITFELLALMVLLLKTMNRLSIKPLTQFMAQWKQLTPGTLQPLRPPEHHTQDEWAQLTAESNQFLRAHFKALTESPPPIHHDILTQLLTGNYFKSQLNERLQSWKSSTTGYPMSTLLMLDIDGFKKKNDSYGHAAGDLILWSLGKLIRRQLREGDLAGRLGGKDFAIWLLNRSLAEGIEYGEELRAAIDDLVLDYEGQMIQFTVSIGVAEFLSDYHTVESALIETNKLLLTAKREGGNRLKSRSTPVSSSDSLLSVQRG